MEKVICSKIFADCVPNNPFETSCGGPAYLGFVFFVAKEDVEHMKEFIVETLGKFGVPLFDIYLASNTEEKDSSDVSTEEKIAECISKDASYLISESRYSYSRSRY